MPREILRFVPNTPVEVALQFPTGKLVAGQYGEQMYFSLEGNRAMYLDPVPAAMVASLNPQKGERFWINKRVSGRKLDAAVWDVYLTLDRSETKLEQDLRDSIVHVEGRKAMGSAPAPPVQQPRGTGTHGPVAAPAAAVRQMPTKRQFADAFGLFLVDAGRATKAAETVLGAEGGSVRFDSRDLAAIATSMFIAADRNGWLTWNGGGE